MARRQRRGRRLHDRGVAKQRVAVAGGERRGNQAAAAGAEDLGPVQGIVVAVLRGELARGVHLRTRDVGVDVDATGHHHHPACVDLPRVRADVVDHLPVPQTHVAHVSVDVVGRVVDGAAADSDLGHVSISASRRLSSVAAVGASPGSGACSASGTPSSR